MNFIVTRRALAGLDNDTFYPYNTLIVTGMHSPAIVIALLRVALVVLLHQRSTNSETWEREESILL